MCAHKIVFSKHEIIWCVHRIRALGREELVRAETWYRDFQKRGKDHLSSVKEVWRQGHVRVGEGAATTWRSKEGGRRGDFIQILARGHRSLDKHPMFCINTHTHIIVPTGMLQKHAVSQCTSSDHVTKRNVFVFVRSRETMFGEGKFSKDGHATIRVDFLL